MDASRLRMRATIARSALEVPGILDRVLRIGEGKILRKLNKLKDQINSIEDDFVDLSDAELRALTDEYKQRLKDGEELDDLLPEAFATVREAAKRTLGQRHFDVQLMGGAALHFGNIAEMKPGESAYRDTPNLTAAAGIVVTVNDYLARDAGPWAASTGSWARSSSRSVPAGAGQADITYGTNRSSASPARQHGAVVATAYAALLRLVDEVGSILIDEGAPADHRGPRRTHWYSRFFNLSFVPDD